MENQERLYSVDPWHWSRSKNSLHFLFLGTFLRFTSPLPTLNFPFRVPETRLCPTGPKKVVVYPSAAKGFGYAFALDLWSGSQRCTRTETKEVGNLVPSPLGLKIKISVETLGIHGDVIRNGMGCHQPNDRGLYKDCKDFPQKKVGWVYAEYREFRSWHMYVTLVTKSHCILQTCWLRTVRISNILRWYCRCSVVMLEGQTYVLSTHSCGSHFCM